MAAYLPLQTVGDRVRPCPKAQTQQHARRTPEAGSGAGFAAGDIPLLGRRAVLRAARADVTPTSCERGRRSHAIKALLVSRALLVKIKRDIENQIRGLLKNLGLVIGQAKMNVVSVRAAELAGARPELTAAVEPLLRAREAVGRQIADLDGKVMRGPQ